MSEPIKFYFSYNQIHETVRQGAQKVAAAGFAPHLLLAIGGGGFIPARILRTFLKEATGRTIPIQAIGLTLYEHDDGCDPVVADRAVRKTQWLTYGSHEAAVSLQGKNILIVDEVDDTRKTLSFAVEELLKDIQAEKAAWLAAQQQQHKRSSCSSIALPTTPSAHSPPDSPQHCSNAARGSTGGGSSSSSEDGSQQLAQAAAAAAAAVEWQEPRVGVFVVHNKLKPKKAELPAQVTGGGCYFSGSDIDDHWVIYPWDALDVWDHTDKAHSPTSATQGLISSPAALAATVPAPMTS